MNPKQISLVRLGRKCIQFGKYEYAQLVINKLIELSDETPEILNEISILYSLMGLFPFSVAFVRRSFEIEKSVNTLRLLAETNFRAGNFEDAAIQYEELTKHIDEESLYFKSAKAYEKLDLYEEALRMLRECVEKYDSAQSYGSLVFQYITVGMEKESIENADIMLRKFPNNPLTFNTLGFLYEAIHNNYEKAKEYFLKAAKMGFKESYYNLGVCCKQSEDFANAEKYLKKLISLKPTSDLDYSYTLGSIYMAQRKVASGYKYYKNRHSAVEINNRNKKLMWDGKDYPNEVLYISQEQGFGDNIQFVRLLPVVAKKFKKVIYGATPNLLDLFQRSFPKEDYPNIEIIENTEVVRYNKFALIMDLPYLLHLNFNQLPPAKPYLKCSERDINLAKTNYFKTDKVKIGLNWRAKGMGLRDAVYRTIDAPYYFKGLFDIEGVDYYSFQMGDIFGMCEKYPQIKDIADNFNTFEDTAASLMNLDILITVDTALAHLAGALGINTYLLLCHAPDWRWFDNTEKTEWYPSIKIIKQKDRRTWDDVSEKLITAIQNDVKKLK